MSGQGNATEEPKQTPVRPQVGRAAAARYSSGFGELELSMLSMVDRLGIVTLGSLARMYHNSHYTARDHVRELCRNRYMERIAIDSMAVQRAIGFRPQVKNPVLGLGGNAYYYLREMHQAEPESARARRISGPLSFSATAKMPHALSVGEAVSYLVAAAHATHEAADALASPNHCSVGVLSERRSAVYITANNNSNNGSTAPGQSDPLDIGSLPQGSLSSGTTKLAGRGKAAPLLVPDATITLAIERHSGRGPFRSVAYKNARWNPTLGSWLAALLDTPPGIKEAAESERSGSTVYRHLLLELESGLNNSRTLNDKVARYNRLHANEVLRTRLYGPVPPTILVVTRTNDQVRNQCLLWRRSYYDRRPVAVIATSLQVLAEAYSASRSALLEAQCWAAVMAPQRPQMLSFSELLAMLAQPQA